MDSGQPPEVPERLANPPAYEMQVYPRYGDNSSKDLPALEPHKGKGALRELYTRVAKSIEPVPAPVVNKGLSGGVGDVGYYKPVSGAKVPQVGESGQCTLEVRNPFLKYQVPFLNLITQPMRDTADLSLKCESSTGEKITSDVDYQSGNGTYKVNPLTEKFDLKP